MIKGVRTVHPLKFGNDLPRTVHSLGGEGACRFLVQPPFIWIQKWGEWQGVPLANVAGVDGEPDDLAPKGPAKTKAQATEAV